MKVFDKVEGWASKVNFVDENNVVLGYDLSQDCCEHAGWFISDYVDVRGNIGDRDGDGGDLDLTDYRFDTSFFMEEDAGLGDVSAVVVFRITDGENEKFIHLFNIHNGYYSHGFDFKNDKTVIQEGYL